MRPPRRVRSVPAGHRYVTGAVGPVGQVEDGLLVLPDPPVPGAPAGVWWPHPALEPQWTGSHPGEADVVHVHFGVEHRTSEQLAQWAANLEQPLVITVHDLRLPHTVDQSAHLARTGVLVGAAAAVVTLTKGAAAEIRRRWGVDAVVLPHPRMVSSQTIRDSVRPAKQEVTVGLHLKGLRANNGGAPLVAAAVEAAGRAGVDLLVHVHEEARDETTLRALDRAEAAGVEVVRTPPMSDAEFHRYLRRIDVSLLPHRWGTHSGWLEECLDLGTVPVAPRVGYLHEQADVPGYSWQEASPDLDGLTDALRRAAAQARSGRSAEEAAAWAEHRRTVDTATRRAHRELYRRVTT